MSATAHPRKPFPASGPASPVSTRTAGDAAAGDSGSPRQRAARGLAAVFDWLESPRRVRLLLLSLSAGGTILAAAWIASGWALAAVTYALTIASLYGVTQGLVSAGAGRAGQPAALPSPGAAEAPLMRRASMPGRSRRPRRERTPTRDF